MSDSEDVITLEVVEGSLKRVLIRRELAELGINASPADVEAYLAMTPRQKRDINMRWAIMMSASQNPD